MLKVDLRRLNKVAVLAVVVVRAAVIVVVAGGGVLAAFAKLSLEGGDFAA
eukprot:COSAG01_NODE_31333_length_599_cov_1.504000_1_plen_50_part_00